MKRSAIAIAMILLISAIPMAGGDTLFSFVDGNGSDASQFGFNVTYLGDINGDGYDDVAVGAPYNDSSDGGRADCGAVYIFFGYPNMDRYHGKNIDVSSANVTIYGANAGDHFGWSLADAGDVNGDGYNDTIVGAPDASTGTTHNGSAYIFYGKTSWAATWDLSTTAADITITGKSDGDKFGASVSGGGDIDNDNYDDIVVGAPDNDTSDGSLSDAGAAYIYYGANPMDTVADVSLYGNKSNGHYGYSVSFAGDVDGDGKDDVIIGEPGNDMAYIYYAYKLSEEYGIVDAPQNETIVEGNESGGSYTDTQSDDNLYRNITENLTTTTGQDSFTDNSADDFNNPAPALNQTRVMWYGAVGLDWSARTWALNESFDTMADGDPGGWTTTDGDVAGDDVAVQSTVFHETNGTTTGKSVKFDDAQTADFERTIIGVTTSGTVIVEGWLMQESGGAGGGLRMVGYELVGNSLYYLYIVGFSDGEIKYYSGTTEYSTGISVVNGQWYHIYVVWYTATATYDVYVDGVLEVSGASSVSGYDTIQYAGFRTYPDAGTTVAYGDDIRIYDANTFYSSGYFRSGIITTTGNIQSVKGEWYNETYGQSLQIRVSRDGGTTWSPVLKENEWYEFTNGEPTGNQLCYNLSFSTSLTDRVTPLLYNITLSCNWSTTTESLEVRYLLDGFSTLYDYYEVQFSASAFNTTTNSPENFTVQYKVDDGAWDALGAGYIINGTGEQYLSELTYAKPSKNITVRVIDNTTGSLPENTIHIDLVRVRCYSDVAPIKLIGDPNTGFGKAVTGAGNVNSAGYDDVIVGAPDYSSGTGRAYAWLDGNFEATASVTNDTQAEFTSTGSSLATSNPNKNMFATSDGDLNLSSSWGSDQLYANYETGGDTDAYIYSAQWIAQPFDVASGDTLKLTNISLYITDVGASDTITVEIRKDVGTKPGTGAANLLASKTIDGGATASWQDFVFDTPPILAGGNKYWICAENTNTVDTDSYTWYLDNGGTYSAGQISLSSDQGSSWSDAGTYAYVAYFRAYGQLGGYSSSAYYDSSITTAPYYIKAIKPYWNFTMPSSTTAWINISRDGGNTWNQSALTNGTWYTFPTEARGEQLRYNVTMKTTNPAYTPVLHNITIYYKYCTPPSVTLTGASPGDKFGYSVSGGSDISGDGIDDIIVGAPYNDTANGSKADAGALYVFNGGSSLPSSIPASNANYINYSSSAGALFGFSVSKAGDVNGDGFNDVIAGSPGYSTNSGKADILSCRKPPKIIAYDLQDSAGVSKLNKQIDVNYTYHFIVNITHPNGWDKVDYVRIHAWYDFGSEATQYNDTLGGNINMFLEYENTTGTGVFRLRWPAGGEVSLGTCDETVINSTTHSLDFNFTPMYQFRYAPGNGWASGPGFNDINSWNFEINVTDSGGWYDSVEDEFGVYRYTYVSASGNPEATGYPGNTYVMSPSTTLTYRSNANYSLNVSLNDDLWNAGHTQSIGASNVAINWTGHDAFVYFTGSGAANAIWIYGSATGFASAPLNGTSQTISVLWRIDIPAGTLADTYSAAVNYTISQT